MKTFLRGALPAAAVCAAIAMFLPAGEAQAQAPANPRNQCGALASGVATCSNQAYANGIQYDVSDGWGNGVAGNVALTVTGGAATTITIPTPATMNDWASGIVVRTATQADSSTRTIALTVGSGTNAVAIAQGTTAAFTNDFHYTGVVIHQRGNAADATTVTLGSGVTMGTSSAPMNHRGVHALTEIGTNTGTLTIDSAATIYSTQFGLFADNRGAGNTAVTNNGSITTAASAGSNRAGIAVLDWSHNPAGASIGGDGRTTTTMTTVTNSGAITTSAANTGHGIWVEAFGLGLYKVVHSGTGASNDINASGAGSVGIRIDAGWHRGVADTDLVEVQSSGDIIASGAGGRGIYVTTSASAADIVGSSPNPNVAVASSGHIKVVTTDGTITTAGANAIGIFVTHDVVTPDEGRATTAEITNAATISSTTYAIAMDTRSSGDVTVTNSGALTVTGANADQAGIRVVDWSHNPAATPTPAIGGTNRIAATMTKVTNSGEIEATTNGHGIWVAAYGLGRYEIVHGVAEEGEVEGSIEVSGADSHGIFVDADYNAGAAVSVTSSGAITASGANGIGIYVRNRAIEGHTVGDDDTPDADLGGDIEVTNSGAITAKNHGILVGNYGNSGAVTVAHSGGAVRSERETGITAEIGNSDSSTNPGTVRVDVTGGSVTASASRIEVAVHARTWGTGSVVANVGDGATLNSRHNVGLFAVIEENADNAVGRISVAQGGTISATGGGVYALVSPASASGAIRTAAQQPAIDIAWTGTFAPPAGEATAPETNSLSHALALDHETAAIALLPRASDGAGILAEAMSWRTASYHVATADKHTVADTDAADVILNLTEPDASATAEVRAAWDRRTAILAEIGETLANTMGTDAVYAIPGVDTDDIDTDGTMGLSAAEIATWLGTRDDRHTVMTKALEYAFTEEEAAVLTALAQGDDPKAALDALETAVGGTLPDGYRAKVVEIAGYRNIGDIRIAVNDGSIASATDGVRALYAWPNNRNGAIDLTIAEGATVTGAEAGVYVAHAGMGSDGILNQHVKVHGTVTGGSDAAVHLAGGGRLTVGRTGKVHAGSSGVAVLVNDPGPANIVVDGLVRGGQGGPAAIHLTGGGTVTVGLTGKVEANGAMLAIRGERMEGGVATNVRVRLSEQEFDDRLNNRDADNLFKGRVDGGVRTPGGNVTFVQVGADGMPTGPELGVRVESDGGIDTGGLPAPRSDPAPAPAPMTGAPAPAPSPTRPATPQPVEPTFNCENLRNQPTPDRRCGLYESVPSVLLAMNALPSYDARRSAVRDSAARDQVATTDGMVPTSAARNAGGGWALIEGGSGKWKAASATQPGMAYDLSHYGVRAGVELAAGDGLLMGVSAHHRRATAEADGAGDIELSGSGVGVNATFSQDGFYADAQAAVTWFDAEITTPRMAAKSDGDGVSWAAALEAGKRIDVSDAMSVTPRGALEWSDASLDAFTESGGGSSDVTVSVGTASSLTGRVGVRVDAAPAGADGVSLFGAVDVAHLLSQEAEARIMNRTLKTTSEETSVRAALGASRSWRDGLSLRGAAHYAASGGDNAGFGGSLSVAMRF